MLAMPLLVDLGHPCPCRFQYAEKHAGTLHKADPKVDLQPGDALAAEKNECSYLQGRQSVLRHHERLVVRRPKRHRGSEPKAP